MAEIGTPDQILRKSSKGQEYGLHAGVNGLVFFLNSQIV